MLLLSEFILDLMLIKHNFDKQLSRLMSFPIKEALFGENICQGVL